MINGSWVNQNGSVMELDDNNGVITGSYISRKGRSAAGKRYPIQGKRNGDVLTFFVDWQDADDNLESITSFSGRIEKDGKSAVRIHTVWILARRWEDEHRTRETGAWNAFLTNSDVFDRLET